MSGISEVDIKDWDYLQIEKISENDDGSANCDLRVGPIAMRFLLNYAVIDILKSTLEKKHE
jgi:hypothetical protein